VSPIQLIFWVHYPGQPLKLVATKNTAMAERLLQVSPYLIKKYGGSSAADMPSALPFDASDVIEIARTKPDTVFVKGVRKWRTQGAALSVGGIRKVPTKRGKQGILKSSYDPVRVLKLTKSEHDAIKAKGGVVWLREALENHPPSVKVAPSRRKGALTTQISFRLSDDHWERFKSLGGIGWLRLQL